ncbi:hypothetical protein L204_102883 [Cryptococcus depauperatus]|nr:translation initiation factor 2D [Cryptococcus depauperatus CBS 7855]
MFKKPLTHQSNATPIRSSARRQLFNAILEQYPSLLLGSGSEDEGYKKELGKLILPEGVRTATFETSSGMEGTFWLIPSGDVLWMAFGRNSKEYIPTLYLLSLPLPHPPLEMIQIYNPMPPPIFMGAPLFIPAVANIANPHLLPNVQEGQVCAFVTSSSKNDQVSYVGVGRVVAKGGMKGAWERRIEHLMNNKGEEEGKFADVLCIIDDHLWALGSKPDLTTFTIPIPQSPIATPPRNTEDVPSGAPSPPIEHLSISEDAAAAKGSAPFAPLVSLSSSEISSLLSISLLQALSHLPPSSFPLSASLLYSSHILPCRPAYIPKEKRDEVVIGKSNWKKLTKWMKEVSKEGLLKIKESKGEVIVVSLDPQHPSLEAHKEYVTISQEETKLAKKAAKEAASDAALNSPQALSQSMAIEELWKPSGGAISFWEAAGIDKSTFHPPHALKQAIDQYVVTYNLIDENDHRFVLLDTELGKAVGVKKPGPGQRMARDEILNKLRNNVSWSVSINGTLKKGAPQPVTIYITSRGGHRTITHIVGLELFSINPADFAEYMRKRCAGAASVGPREGVSPKLGLQEVQVQGAQQRAAIEALGERGVPKRWIRDEGKRS